MQHLDDQIQQNTTFGAANIERKKYDPVYQVTVSSPDGDVIYVGKVLPFGQNAGCLTVKGVQYPFPKGKKTLQHPLEQDMLKYLNENNSSIVEDTFPLHCFSRIRKIA